MFQKITIKITGVSPLMFHNGQLADSLNPHTKQLAAITSKRKKTEADHERMSEIEWRGGLYVDEKNRVILPAELIEATIRDGAKKTRKGKDATSAVFVEEDALLKHSGPKNIDKLFADKNFVDRRRVKIKTACIMRTRPIFNEWEAVVVVQYNDEVVNQGDLVQWIKSAGRDKGVGDYRPRYGRFDVEVLG